MRLTLVVTLAVGFLVALAVMVWTNSRAPIGSDWFGEILDPAREAYGFDLPDQNGKPFQLSSLKGKVVLLNFGFACCPNVCPVSLSNLSAARRLLPEEARPLVEVVFISVDKRDKPSDLKNFLSHFDGALTGLSGPEDTIGRIARAYGAFFRKDPNGPQNDDDYLIDHSTKTYLIDPAGKLRLFYTKEQISDHRALANDLAKVLGLPQAPNKPGS